MPARIILTSGRTSTPASELERSLYIVRPRVLAIASAFVSVYGAEWALDIAQRIGSERCRLIAGRDHFITHPEALELARTSGWDVRFGIASQGIFHPKFLVGGQRFRRDGCIRAPVVVYAGSANLTRNGLTRNVECGFLAEEEIPGAADAFAEMWNAASPVSTRSLRDYSAAFAEANRRRSAAEIEALGVSETKGSARPKPHRLLHQPAPATSSVGPQYANAAWTGLQSFTGEYTFQVEFPRSAGQVVRAMIHGRATAGGYVDVFCEDTGQTLRMKFAFYQDNSMFRLNVPNDVPNVAWARSHHDGIALVSQGPTGGAPIRLRIIRPGEELDEAVGKSVGLATWGRTQTRLYGWF